MKRLVFPATLLAASLSCPLDAATINFNFTGPGVSGSIELTYGTTMDVNSHGLEVTGISGTFSDTNNGLNLVNVTIGPLVPVNHSTPDSTNLLAPADFSKFAVATGLAPVSGGFLTYDNLYYPSGSPQTASDYPLHGGFLDIYGLLFDIGGGRVVDLWSNGDVTGTGAIDYGVAVATASTALDYVSGGVTVTPEPAGVVLLGSGLAAMLAWRRASAIAARSRNQ